MCFMIVLEGKIYDINWFNNILTKLKYKLAAIPDPEILRKEFEVLNEIIFYLYKFSYFF